MGRQRRWPPRPRRGLAAVQREHRSGVRVSGRTGRLDTAPALILAGTDGRYAGFGATAYGGGDLNADGYADVAVGSYVSSTSVGYVRVFLGGPSGLGATPAVTLVSPEQPGGGFEQGAFAGDLDGDGYGDLVVGAEHIRTSTGAVYVYFGRAAGPASTPSAVLYGPDGINGVLARAAGGALPQFPSPIQMSCASREADPIVSGDPDRT